MISSLGPAFAPSFCSFAAAPREIHRYDFGAIQANVVGRQALVALMYAIGILSTTAVLVYVLTLTGIVGTAKANSTPIGRVNAVGNIV